MAAVYMKEMKSLMRSFYGWAFLAVMTFFASIYLVSNNFFYGNPYISWTLSGFLMIPLFVLPLLTMRTYAEERKQKTEQLLLTSPLSVGEIVFGKFFAIATIVLISVMIFLISFFIMMLYGEVPVAENLLAIVAFYLYCLICIAIGLLISSLTEHQFVAAIMTYVVYLAILLVPSVLNTVFPDSWFSKFFTVFDYIERFTNLFNGMILISDIVYIVSVIGILLILTYFSVGRNSLLFQKSGKKCFVANISIMLIGIVVLVGANFVCKYTALSSVQYDLTKRQLYSVSDNTKEVLQTLEDEVCIYVIGDEASVDQAVVLYAAEYERHSPKIKIEYKSDITDPLFYQNYSDEKLEHSSMIVTYKDAYRIVNYSDCYEYQYVNGQFTTTGVDIEGQVTAAISSMQNNEISVVYELVGHGELGVLEQSVISRMNKGGYKYETLNLLETGAIPDEGACIIISGPQYDLTQDEISMLTAFSQNGGDLILFASHPAFDTPNYNAFMESFGVSVLNDYVCDIDYTKIYQSQFRYLWGDRQYHKYTSSLDSNRMNFFPETRGFTILESEDSPYTVESLYQSSETSLTYSEILSMNGEDIGVSAEELPDGPFSLAFLATPKNEKQGEVLAIGSAMFLLPEVDAVCASANSEFFLAVLGEMMDMELNVTIPTKSFAYQTVVVPTAMILLFGILLMLLVPMAFVVTGIVICVMRRKR